MKQWLIDSLTKNVVFLPIIVASSVAFFILMDMHRLQRKSVETVAYVQSKSQIDLLESFRSLYTSEVVNIVTNEGFEASHDYHQRSKHIPLPATLSILIGNEKSQGLRLYSAYPFPWRVNKDGGPQDSFEKEALEHLSDSPDDEFYRVETVNGERFFRYARADVLRAACVTCHNSHPQTPKNDWKEGDVRGVLASKVPLEDLDTRLLTHIKSSLFSYIASICLSLLVFIKRFGG